MTTVGESVLPRYVNLSTKLKSLYIDVDVGFNVGLPWTLLVHYLSLHGADYEPKVVAGITELANAVLFVPFGGNVEGAMISKQEDVDGIC